MNNLMTTIIQVNKTKNVFRTVMILLTTSILAICEDAGTPSDDDYLAELIGLKIVAEEFARTRKALSLRLIEETKVKKYTYKDNRVSSEFWRIKQTFQSPSNDITVVFRSRAFKVSNKRSLKDLEKMLIDSLKCEKVVWSRENSKARMPYSLSIGRDSVEMAIGKVGFPVVSKNLDANESGEVNFWEPFSGPPISLHFETGKLSKIVRFD